ncbi:hypothetical protein EYF80_054168 [Liparis tanakae]|uniref:Uncharacterized protein n=1 Tax=Liparis tanakae TaxID=230148 RepID=A0A4Z2F369_9TELE|nr:hypothetical protein EYF80_054168 [Liparis tanakae]
MATTNQWVAVAVFSRAVSGSSPSSPSHASTPTPGERWLNASVAPDMDSLDFDPERHRLLRGREKPINRAVSSAGGSEPVLDLRKPVLKDPSL